MSLTLEFRSILCAAIIWMSQGEAGSLPPPRELTYMWLDPLTVNISWKEPQNLLDGCSINYKVKVLDTAGRKIQGLSKLTDKTHAQGTLLTENYEPAEWTISVHAIGSLSCEGGNSTAVTETIRTQKPKAKVVEDFKCYIHRSHLECSWKPGNPSLNVSLSYRKCYWHDAPRKECNRTHTNGDRIFCYIEDKEEKFVQQEICMIAMTDAGLSTFKIEYALASPQMSITEDGSELKLKIEEMEVAAADCWRYNICYKECNTQKTCQEYSKNIIKLPYDNRCYYEFRYEVKTVQTCLELRSDWSDVVTYGANKPDVMMTVVFIIVPIVLSACVILSCYCFRRHSDIICPTIPDPSAIFKEMMMMNGNKDVKPITGLLYSPEEEEQCKITLVADDSDLHQNS